MPVSVFGCCYGRIFHVVRRQSKVRTDQDISMASTSRDPNAELQMQQTIGTTGSKLSKRELNVLQTMISVIVCFLVCWSVSDIAEFLQSTEVSIYINKTFFIVNSMSFLNFSVHELNIDIDIEISILFDPLSVSVKLSVNVNQAYFSHSLN